MTDDGPARAGADAGDDAPADDLPDEPLADLAADVREQRATDDATGPNEVGDEEGRPSSSVAGDRDATLGELAAEIERRRTGAGDEDLSELFTSREVAELDVDAIWERVESGGVDVDPDEVTGDERVVEKASYCQQCEYFSEPPEVACGHEGTAILELVDTDRFRVRGCPKVAEDEQLDDLER